MSTSNKEKALTTMTVGENKIAVQFQIDSGAECNVLSAKVYVEATSDPNYKNLQPTKASVIRYNSSEEEIIGTCKLTAS